LALRRSSVPVVTKDYIVSGFANGKIVAINRTDGTVNWSADVATPKGRSDIQRMVDISADLVVKDEVVYVVSYQGNLTAFALHTGQVIWEREVSSYAGIVVDHRNVYVSAANGDVLAFDRHTGGSVWVQKALHGRDLSRPEIQKNTIIVCDEDGLIHWLDKKRGQLIGRYKFTGKGGIEAPPIVYADDLYLYGRNGKVGEVVACFE
jgi:outer membrane protein assembly factor BamB